MQDKRVLIFANGERANLEVLRAWLRPTDVLIAADGGLRFLRALGLAPHLVIGDLDSLGDGEIEQLSQAGVEVRRYPVHKDETDLELALLAAVAAGANQIWVVAALGGRLDMTLANIALLMLPELTGAAVRLEDGYESVFLIRPGKPGEVQGQPGERLSLLPLNGPARGVRTQGLEYPLHGESLRPERSRGISNRLQAPIAQISLEDGLLLCIHSHHQPDSISD
jgi:thiamine pyrophosphokinase